LEALKSFKAKSNKKNGTKAEIKRPVLSSRKREKKDMEKA